MWLRDLSSELIIADSAHTGHKVFLWCRSVSGNANLPDVKYGEFRGDRVEQDSEAWSSRHGQVNCMLAFACLYIYKWINHRKNGWIYSQFVRSERLVPYLRTLQL